MRKDIDLTDPTAPPSPSAVAGPRGQRQPRADTQRDSPAPYDKALQPVTVANGTGVPARTQEIIEALTAGGFTQVGQLAAQPVAATVVYYGAGFADVAADVAALLGIPAARCCRPPGSPASRSTWAATCVGGTPGADAAVQLP